MLSLILNLCLYCFSRITIPFQYFVLFQSFPTQQHQEIICKFTECFSSHLFRTSLQSLQFDRASLSLWKISPFWILFLQKHSRLPKYRLLDHKMHLQKAIQVLWSIGLQPYSYIIVLACKILLIPNLSASNYSSLGELAYCAALYLCASQIVSANMLTRIAKNVIFEVSFMMGECESFADWLTDKMEMIEWFFEYMDPSLHPKSEEYSDVSSLKLFWLPFLSFLL